MLKKLINIVKIALPLKKNKPSGKINLSAHFQKAIKDDIQCEKDKVIYMETLQNRLRKLFSALRGAQNVHVLRVFFSLYPQLEVDMMETVLNRESEINHRIYVLPTSAIKENGKKISYFEYISSLQNEDCNQALKRISERIHIENIYRLIDAIPAIKEIQKDFYKTMIFERKTKIIDYSMALLFKQGLL